MQSLGDLYSGIAGYFPAWGAVPSEEERMQQSAKVIAVFPNEAEAQIKSDIKGNLFLPGYGTWINVQLGRYTELPETVKAISGTFKFMQVKLKSNLESAQNTELPTAAQINEVTDGLNFHSKMMKGLKNIQAVYTARYDDVAEKEGIEKLNKLVEKAKQDWSQHQTDGKSLQNRMMEIKSDDDAVVKAVNELVREMTLAAVDNQLEQQLASNQKPHNDNE